MSATKPAFRPADTAQARAAVLDTLGPGSALLFQGAGTKLRWGGVPRFDAVIDTGAMDQLHAHDAGDMTATMAAGMPLQTLQDELRAAGQWLAIDPPPTAPGATVGGVFAANDFGPRRLRYGAMRDLVIGLTVVLADGTVARSGGRVIKNVAGYDLAKLFAGSLGTLGLVTELTVRLHPLPEASQTVHVEADVEQATRLTLALLAAPIEPSAVDYHVGSGTAGTLLVRLEGPVPSVAAQVRQVTDLAAGARLSAAVLDGRAERDAWLAMGEAARGSAGETVAVSSGLPSQLPQVARTLREAAALAGIEAELHSHAGLGLHQARFRGPVPGAPDASAHAVAVGAWRRLLRPLGMHATLRDRPPDVDRLVDPWLDRASPPPAALPLMRRVKEQLDPDGRCAPGRMLGGI